MHTRNKLHNIILYEFCWIEWQVNEETSEVRLNAADLEVSKVQWESAGNKQEAKSFSLDEKTETLRLSFEPSLKPSHGTLRIEFTGTLNDKMKGFYRSKFRGADGEDRYNAVTQFEATDARRCFPSWDEPAIKVKNYLILVVLSWMFIVYILIIIPNLFINYTHIYNI